MEAYTNNPSSSSSKTNPLLPPRHMALERSQSNPPRMQQSSAHNSLRRTQQTLPLGDPFFAPIRGVEHSQRGAPATEEYFYSQTQTNSNQNIRHTMPVKRGKSSNELEDDRSDTGTNNVKTIYGWGQNREGQLSVKSTDLIDQIVKQPARVLGLRGPFWPNQVASGNTHSVAVAQGGGVLVCGSAVLGRVSHLVDHSKLKQKRFQMIQALQSTKFTQVACGDYHTVCLAEDGLLYSWGGSNNSKLMQRPSVAVTAIDSSPVRQRSNSGSLTNRTNENGQKALSDASLYAVMRPLKDKKIKQIACGDFHTLALELTGQLWSWGGGGQAQHNRGQLGHGNRQMELKPSLVTFFAQKEVTMIAAGSYHSLALTADQTLYAWGYGKYGQTGTGDFVDTNAPRPCISQNYQDKTRQVSIASFSKVIKKKEYAVMNYEDKIKQISAGGNHSMILTEAGAMYAFGYGAHGQLGLGVIQNLNVPTLVKNFLPPQVLGYTEEAEEMVNAIALGQNHSLALSSEGSVYSCGACQFGQLGQAGVENLPSFQRVEKLDHIVKIQAGGNTSWAIKDVQAFKAQHSAFTEEIKAVKLQHSLNQRNSSPSPAIKEEGKGADPMLLTEDVENYDHFLARSTYLDSPQEPVQQTQQRMHQQDRRITAGFGQPLNEDYNLLRPRVYEESQSDIGITASRDVMSEDSMDVQQPALDFMISFTKSQTEYFHRFIRFKNIDPDRQVILENAVERYLVYLEKDSEIHQPSGFSLFRQSLSETVIYNTLQEDSAVANPVPGKKSFTLLMIMERKSQRGAQNQTNLLSMGSQLHGNQLLEQRGGNDPTVVNYRENLSQFSNPFSGELTPNQSDFAILPIDQGVVKTMRYSELSDTQKSYGIAKWARKFQHFTQGIYYIDHDEESQGELPQGYETQVALANISFMELQP